MGKFFKSLGSIFGIGGGARPPKVQAPKPVAVDKALDTVEEDKAATKARRVNLFETEGGVSGQELTPEEIQKRPTLLGN